MPQIRIVKNQDYTVVCNAHLRDKRLSLKAKGVMTLMLSLPEEWDYSIKGLTTLSDDGKASTSAAIAELEACGYLVREQSRDGGKFGACEYTLYEQPQPLTEKPSTEKPSTEKPSTENRSTVPPTPPVKEYNIINQLLTNKSEARAPAHTCEEDKPIDTTETEAPADTAETGKTRRFVKPTLDEVKAYIAERGSSVDAHSWYDHYESNGWMVGKTPMRDWKAAVRTWERNGIKPPGSGTNGSNCNPQKSYMTDEQWKEFFDAAVDKELKKYENKE